MALAGVYDIFNDRWCNQTVWIYSDTHFGDTDLAEGIASRPSTEEHIKLINSKVGRKDTLIHLGDVGDLNAVKQLKGYKVLICGNHDVGHTAYKRQKWTKVFDKDEYTKGEVLAIMAKDYPDCKYSIEEGFQFHRPFDYWEVTADNCLFDEVYPGPLMIGEKLILSHEPVDVPWAFNIHGHDHKGAKRKNHLNVCADVVKYTPVNMNQFMKTGALAHIDTIHRDTIDKATVRKKKRGGKKLGGL